MLLARAGSGPPAPAAAGAIRSLSWRRRCLCALLLEVLGLAAFALAALGAPRRGPASTRSRRWSACSLFAYVPGSRSASGWPPSRRRCCWTALVGIAAVGCVRPGGWRRGRPCARRGGRDRGVVLGRVPLFLAPARRQPRDLLGREADGLLVPQHALPGDHPAPAGAVVRRLAAHRTPTSGTTSSPRSARRSRSSRRVMFNLGIAAGRRPHRRGVVRRRRASRRRVAVGAAAAGLDALARQPRRRARAAGAARGQLRLLLGHLARHPRHHQRVPVLELRLRRPARAPARDALRGRFRRARDRAGSADGRSPPTTGRAPPRRPLLVLAALALGAITVTNGWSMPTYVALLLALLGADWLVHGTRGGFVRSVRTGVTVGRPAGRGRDRRRRPGVPAVLAAASRPRPGNGAQRSARSRGPATCSRSSGSS